VQRELDHHGWLRRYSTDDGFGKPDVAFIICTFWLVEALARIGNTKEARSVLTRTLGALSPTGLLAEDWDPVHRRLWGNYPQAYSHVGLIHAAFAASPPWSEVE
jgi:GH15 family glucan-1,4-alpha-glucosidase